MVDGKGDLEEFLSSNNERVVDGVRAKKTAHVSSFLTMKDRYYGAMWAESGD